MLVDRGFRSDCNVVDNGTRQANQHHSNVYRARDRRRHPSHAVREPVHHPGRRRLARSVPHRRARAVLETVRRHAAPRSFVSIGNRVHRRQYQSLFLTVTPCNTSPGDVLQISILSGSVTTTSFTYVSVSSDGWVTSVKNGNSSTAKLNLQVDDLTSGASSTITETAAS